jgi:hypothetical protein
MFIKRLGAGACKRLNVFVFVCVVCLLWSCRHGLDRISFAYSINRVADALNAELRAANRGFEVQVCTEADRSAANVTA